jgi:hypothetical protein
MSPQPLGRRASIGALGLLAVAIPSHRVRALEWAKWCCKRGLNSRPLPYQGSALPLSYCSLFRASPPPKASGFCHRRRPVARRGRALRRPSKRDRAQTGSSVCLVSRAPAAARHAVQRAGASGRSPCGSVCATILIGPSGHLSGGRSLTGEGCIRLCVKFDAGGRLGYAALVEVGFLLPRRRSVGLEPVFVDLRRLISRSSAKTASCDIILVIYQICAILPL